MAEGVFVTQLSSDVGISVRKNCVGYDKSLFHEQYVNRKIKGNES
jgi:hypothetical protein